MLEKESRTARTICLPAAQFDVELLQTRALQLALDRLATKQKMAVVLVDVEGLTGAVSSV